MPSGPDDFGLTPMQTLARVGDPVPSPDHSVFWTAWFQEVSATRPILAPGHHDLSDDSATHVFGSVGRVRVGCRLLLPPDRRPVRAGLVTTHGYRVDARLEDEARRWAALAALGVAVLLVRVRGFPGSQLDTGDLVTPDDRTGDTWITRGLAAGDREPESTLRWTYPQGVADVVNACRAMRNALAGRYTEVDLGPATARRPLFLHGESFGGALAVIAAATLAGRLPNDSVIDRFVLALPSMGDWPWRADHPAGGVQREIADALRRHAAHAHRIHARLRLADTVVHAVRVRRPTLCKLAELDDVVPAPTQAAIFNALGTDPGEKWRFIVPCGHYDGGLANARRHALFDRCTLDFLDPGNAPTRAMRGWEPLLRQGDRAPDDAREDGSADGPADAPTTLFGAEPDEQLDARDRLFIDAYRRAGRTLDSLPYTDEFEAVHAEVGGSDAVTKRALFHRLHTLRKAGSLPRMGRAPEHTVRLDADDEALLTAFVVDVAGSLGQRDRLPYTPEFEALLERFNAKTGRQLGPHDCWRLIAKLAK